MIILPLLFAQALGQLPVPSLQNVTLSQGENRFLVDSTGLAFLSVAVANLGRDAMSVRVQCGVQPANCTDYTGWFYPSYAAQTCVVMNPPPSCALNISLVYDVSATARIEISSVFTCASAPDCAALNREPCASQNIYPNTCGSCLYWSPSASGNDLCPAVPVTMGQNQELALNVTRPRRVVYFTSTSSFSVSAVNQGRDAVRMQLACSGGTTNCTQDADWFYPRDSCQTCHAFGQNLNCSLTLTQVYDVWGLVLLNTRVSCELAPNCTLLNRLPCASQSLPNTCGRCLSLNHTQPGNFPCVPVVENYTDVWVIRTMASAPDGYPREVIGIFREADVSERMATPVAAFPGPPIRIKTGGYVNVTVKNMLDETTSIHWHGIHMKNQVWMDGTDHVTQHGILPGASFTYNFQVNQDAGTHWYHSHSGAQYGDGLFGPFIIEADADPVFSDWGYVRDYNVMLQDWLYESRSNPVTKYISVNDAFHGFKPDYPWPLASVLINGQGQSRCEFLTEEDCVNVRLMGWEWFHDDGTKPPPIPFNGTYVNGTKGQCNPIRAPYFGSCTKRNDSAQFYCVEGENIRLRVINSGIGVAFRFWVDRHNLTVVARDGVPIQPDGPHQAVFLSTGQRLDLILACRAPTTQSAYKMFAAVAEESYNFSIPAPIPSAYALLIYDGVIPLQPEFPPEAFPNKDITRSWGELGTKYLAMREYSLKSRTPMTVPAASVPTSVWNVNNRGNWWNSGPATGGTQLEWWDINNSSAFTMPANPALESLYNGIPLNDSRVFGPKVPFVYEMFYDAANPRWYEIVITNDEQQLHPWHVHGYTAHLVGFGYFDNTSYINYSTPHGPPKDSDSYVDGVFKYDPRHHNLPAWNEPSNSSVFGDTFTVPPFGFVVLRIRADNPGLWLIHCHMEYHLVAGMGGMLLTKSDDLKRDLQPHARSRASGLALTSASVLGTLMMFHCIL